MKGEKKKQQRLYNNLNWKKLQIKIVVFLQVNFREWAQVGGLGAQRRPQNQIEKGRQQRILLYKATR